MYGTDEFVVEQQYEPNGKTGRFKTRRFKMHYSVTVQ